MGIFILGTINRLRFHDWALYDAHHVVFQPARFSLFDLQKAQKYYHKKFYSLKQMFGKILVGQLKPKPGARISVDYREDVSLEF